MTAIRLYKKYSKEQLLLLQDQISGAPENRNTDGSMFLYTAQARKKLDAIAQAITFHLADQREAAGMPVPTCGYSGQQQNRRR